MMESATHSEGVYDLAYDPVCLSKNLHFFYSLFIVVQIITNRGSLCLSFFNFYLYNMTYDI